MERKRLKRPWDLKQEGTGVQIRLGWLRYEGVSPLMLPYVRTRFGNAETVSETIRR